MKQYGISAHWRQGHGEEDIGSGVRMDLSCRDFTGSALMWNGGKNLARGRVALERSFGTELWNGALERSFGTELWNRALEQSFGIELWNRALERSFGTVETKPYRGRK